VGVVRGKDERHASTLLRKQRLTPMKTVALPAALSGVGANGELPLKQQAEVHLQLSQLTGRGVPLVEALDVVGQTFGDGSMGQQRVQHVREMVASGSSFSDACRKAKLFDVVTTAVYASAERTGDLSGAAKQLSTTARRQLALRGKVGTLLMYPLIVMGISVIVSIFLLTYIVPKVGRTLESQLVQVGKQLPIYTRVLMAVGEFMRDHWLVLLAAACGAAIAAIIFRVQIAKLGTAIMHRTPILSDVVLAQESARFFTVMAAMTRSGINLADALNVGANAINHKTLRAQLHNLRAKLIEGGVLRHLIDTVTALPVGTRKLMIAAERAGDLETAFDTLGQDMADELDRRTSRLLAVLEPLLIVFMAISIGGLLMAVMIPMLTVANQLG
jgi:type II secretory pathway component PulF